MSELLQNVIVTIVATGAGAVVVRRLVGTFGSAKQAPHCDSCPSAKQQPPVTTPIPLSSLRTRKDTPLQRTS